MERSIPSLRFLLRGGCRYCNSLRGITSLPSVCAGSSGSTTSPSQLTAEETSDPKKVLKEATLNICNKDAQIGLELLDKLFCNVANAKTEAQPINVDDDIAVKKHVKAKQKPSGGSFLYSTDQVLPCLKRILRTTDLDDPVEQGKKFVISLATLGLAKVEDSLIQEIISGPLERAISLYEELCSPVPYPKVFVGAALAILRKLHDDGDKKRSRRKRSGKMDELEKRFNQILEKQGSVRQRICLQGAVYLMKGSFLHCADLLKSNDMTFGIDEVNYFTTIAMKCHEPAILFPMVEFGAAALPQNTEARSRIYNALAVLYGKRKDFERLDVLWKLMHQQLPKRELPHFKHVFHRCRHFFRCANRPAPPELLALLKRIGDY